MYLMWLVYRGPKKYDRKIKDFFKLTFMISRDWYTF